MRMKIQTLILAISMLIIIACDKRESDDKFSFASPIAYQEWVVQHEWILNCAFEPINNRTDSLSAAFWLVYNKETYLPGSPPHWLLADNYTVIVNDVVVNYDAHVEDDGHLYLRINGFGVEGTTKQLKIQFKRNSGNILDKIINIPDFPTVQLHQNADSTMVLNIDKINWTHAHKPDYQKLNIRSGDFTMDNNNFTETVMLRGSMKEYLREENAPSYFPFIAEVTLYNAAEQNSSAIIVSTTGFALLGE